jgi:predicted permease
MRVLAYLRSLASRFVHRDQLEDEMAEELRAHLELRADDLARSGMTRAAAERQARVEFGGQSRFKDEARDMVAGRVIETIGRDARLAVRQLRKSPSFAIAAVVTLAMAIGANAVVFSAINGLILRPLDLPNEQSLYVVERTADKSSSESYPNYVDLRDRTRSFESLAGFSPDQLWITSGATPSRAWAFQVTGNYFDALGIRPYLGRFFHAAEEQGINSAPYVVLSYPYWRTHFDGNAAVIGRTIRINKQPYTIVGVAPEGFRGTIVFFSPDLFVPLVNQPQLDGTNLLTGRGQRLFAVIGHLKPGVTPTQAVAELDALGEWLEKTYPRENETLRFMLGRPSLNGDALAAPMKAFLGGLMLLAALILVAACTNLGSLFAARAAERSREVALQLALGASRIRIVRQLLSEAVVIALIGGAVGLWGSAMLLRWLSVWHPFPQFPLNMPVAADARVYLVALALSVASGLVFGAVPLRQVLRTDPYAIIKGGAPAGASRRLTVRDLLLVAQIAVCALLVTSSMVALRGLVRSLRADFGFDPRNVTLVETDLAMAGYRAADMPAMQRRMIDALQTIPGAEAVALIGRAPPILFVSNGSKVFKETTPDLTPASAAADAVMYGVSPDYFRAAHTRLASGRQFTWHDDASAPRVAIVNHVFARRVFGSPTGAIGRFYKMPDGARVQVVGLIPDGKTSLNLADDPQPAMFFPILQSPYSDTWLVIRSERDLSQLSTTIRAKLHELDPGLPSFIETWTTAMQAALFAPRMASLTLGVLGAMGAILSVTGIFGMAAYSLTKRLKELGIRVALGAPQEEILRAALGRPFKVLLFGSAAGLVLGVLASRVLSFIVYQATPRDPIVLAGVVLAMFVVGLTATWIPARRALLVDPLILLRDE